MCVRKPGAGDALLKGRAHTLLAETGKVDLIETSGEGYEIDGLEDHLDATCRSEAEGKESKNVSINVGNGYGMQPGEENHAIPEETNFSGVLESLMSLDSRGDFMGPLDGFSAPNHSRGIESPMCFAMMHEKICTQQYSAWRVFVGDFERICYNALRCNQKRSILWAAADDLLRRGKKRLEQYEECGETLIALKKNVVPQASFDSKTCPSIKPNPENVKVRVYQDHNSLVPKELKVSKSSATSGTAVNMPPSSEVATLCNGASVNKDTCLTQRSKEEIREKQMSRKATSFLPPVLDVGSVEPKIQKDALRVDDGTELRSVDSGRRIPEILPLNISSALGQTDDSIDVEGDIDAKSEDHRFGAKGDATESSSSYGSAGSGLEDQHESDRMQSTSEAESVLRDGNGAVGLLDDDDGLPSSEREKKALDADWKLYRRGIEWRCHWLELRAQAIQAKIAQYDELLKNAQSEKIWRWEGEVGEGTTARTVPVKILRNHHVIHRKHRKRAEDALDLDLGRHPVFSRYEKRKTQRKSDDGIVLTQGKVDSQQVQQTEIEIAEPETNFENEYVKQQQAANNTFVGQDSMEQLLWQVEALQARVKKQKHLLKKEAAMQKKSAVIFKGGPQRGSSSAQVLQSPRTVPRGGLPSSSCGSLGRTSSGSGLVRRRASDYDINNMVMPVNVGGTFVEQVRHVDIETPLWRIVEDATPAVQLSEQSSSDEETEDEHYVNRHSVMEALERQQRYIPPPKRSAGDIHTVGKGKLKVGIGKSAVQMAGKAIPSAPAPISSDNVPKRQRSSRIPVRRAPASLLDSSAAQTRPPEVMVGEPEAESKLPVDGAVAKPLGFESGGYAVTTAENNLPLDCMDEDDQ